MLSWISENLGTIIVGAVLCGAVACIVVAMARGRKKGSSCCGDCASCKMCSSENGKNKITGR